jgi:tetratricopeptide (TPR) repeat protein
VRRLILTAVLFLAGIIVFSGFQCASRNISTAKMKIQTKEYDKAIQNLKEELALKPESPEANLLLVKAYYLNKDFIDAANAAGKAEETNAGNPQGLMEIRTLTYATWIELYNKAINYYNKADDGNKAILDTMLMYVDAALEIRPENVNNWNMKGLALDQLGKTDEAIDAYKMFVEKFRPEIEAAETYGLYLGMKMTDLFARAGAPAPQDRVSALPSGDTMYVNLFNSAGSSLYVSSLKAAGTKTKLISGWLVNPPDNWSRDEKFQNFQLTVAPIANIADYCIKQEDWNCVIDYVSILTKIEPLNQEANRTLVLAYQKTNKIDQAVKSLEELTTKYPDNKIYWANWGDLLLNTNIEDRNVDKFKEAIGKYEKALEIDKNFDVALVNIAATYKNIASVEQKKQEEMLDENPDMEPNTDAYFPDLEKSAEYFERVLAIKDSEFHGDYTIMSELANIYLVLDKEEELRGIVKKLEAEEYALPASKKEDYYYKMLKIYSMLKESEKTQEVKQKIENLK